MGEPFNWLFKEERLRRTPSIKIGISHGQELFFRQKQAMLMQTIGQKSGLTPLAINTSVIFMHRFYMYRTIKFFPRIHVAIGFVFAAGKVEESARKLEHLIRFTVDVLRNNKNGEFLDKRDKLTYEMDCEWREKIETLCQNNCDVSSVAYEEMRKTVLECETEIYAVIGFQLQITHPHKFVIRMSSQLGADNIKDISQYAYNLATVSTQLTLLNLKYKPETIATVCLNIASKAHSVKFMSNKDTNKYWYRVCDPAAEFKEIEAVSEEFLALIKACPLLPSWMTNLSRGPTRAVARQPGHPHRPVAPSGNHHPPSSSRQPPPRPPTSQPAAATSSSDTTSGSHSQQPASSTTTSSSSSSIPHSEAGSATSTSSSSHPAVPSSTSSSSHHSQHHPDSNRQQQQQLAPSGASSSANRPPSSTVPGASGSSSSSGSNRHHPQHQHHHQQQQLHHQRSHPSAPPSSRGGHHKSQQPPVPGSRPQQPPSSSSSSRPQPPSTGHAAPPNPSSSSSSLQYPPRPDYPRRPEGTAPQERRPPSQYPVEDVNRHHSQQQRQQQQPSVNQNLSSSHLTEIPRSTQPVPQAQQPPPQQQQTSMVSNPTTPPEPYPGSLANDTPDFLASPSDSNHGSQSLSAAAAAAAGVGPKLSLSSYRERLGTRIRPGQSSSSQNDSLNTDDSGIHTAASEENCSSLDTNTLSVDSPNNSNVSTPDLGSSFSVPQDSPTNPRLKLKVKRESSLAAGAAGPSATPGDKQQHNVKYADSGLRIKIKPPKMELLKDEELSGGASRSGTPVEEGEVFDSPSSTGSSDRRSDGSLKMRLTIPKRGETEMNGSGDGVDQSSSGGHRSHHHSGHHHRKHHHHHKSKKHKQSSSRHEGKSSKRSGDHHEERPSKASRMDHDSQSSTSTSVYRGPVPMHNQNSGFSINDAFSSTMPNNIFDDEDDSSQSTAPPITPTPDSVPSHHHHRMYRQSSSSRKPPSSSSSSLPSMNSMLEDPPHHHHFHQLMAQHRANEAKKPPLPPLPASNQPPPPPPPPPPRSPPPSAF